MDKKWKGMDEDSQKIVRNSCLSISGLVIGESPALAIPVVGPFLAGIADPFELASVWTAMLIALLKKHKYENLENLKKIASRAVNSILINILGGVLVVRSYNVFMSLIPGLSVPANISVCTLFYSVLTWEVGRAFDEKIYTGEFFSSDNSITVGAIIGSLSFDKIKEIMEQVFKNGIE